MPADAHPMPIRLGEARDIYASLTPDSGTETVADPATCTLYDHDGALAGTFTADTAVTGQETGAQAEWLVWYKLAPSAFNLTAGTYMMVFKITNTNGRIYRPSVMVVVQGNVD